MVFTCPHLAVPMEIMQHVVSVESSGNPYAIGIVGAKLQRQPRNLPEAVATAKMLEQKGYNFSLGISQVNRYNLSKYGLTSYEHAFQICPNLHAGSHILRECFERSKDWGKSFSCYYSGNFVTGFRHGYVQKIFNSMRKGAFSLPYPSNSALAIPNSRTTVQQIENYQQKNTTTAYATINNNLITPPMENTPSPMVSNNAPTTRIRIKNNTYNRKQKEYKIANNTPSVRAQLNTQASAEPLKNQQNQNTDSAFVF